MSLRVESNGSVVQLVLDRPDSYNAVNAEMRDALLRALEDAERIQARCIVLSGAGRGFCGGADLQSGAADLRGVDVGTTMRRSTSRLAEALMSCPIPIIASVHGVCAGVGLTLALAADHCIAADNARFYAAFTERSLVPDGGVAWLLPRIIGLGRARSILMLASAVPARQALDIGMVGEVVAPDELGEISLQRAAQLADRPTHALSMTKSLLSRSFEMDLGTALAEERWAQSLASTTEDYAEGISAFREKRDPTFVGH